MPGPVPKRSSQRRRRNKGPEGPPPTSGKGSGTSAWVAYAESLGIAVPEGASRAQVQELVAQGAGDDGWHPLAREWFDSLADSGQAGFFEPSDWATARVYAEVLSSAVRLLREGGRGAGTLIERWQVGATELLTTEGARRRARIELEREADGQDEETTADVSELAEYRRRRTV